MPNTLVTPTWLVKDLLQELKERIKFAETVDRVYGAVNDAQTGISMRLVKQFDSAGDKSPQQFDVIYGVAGLFNPDAKIAEAYRAGILEAPLVSADYWYKDAQPLVARPISFGPRRYGADDGPPLVVDFSRPMSPFQAAYFERRRPAFGTTRYYGLDE